MKVLWCAILISVGIGCATASQETPTVGAPSQAAVQEKAPEGPKKFTLSAEAFWRLELPNGRFDASGLLRYKGDLLVVSDEDPTLYKIHLGETNSARLEKTDIFTAAQLRQFAGEKHGRFDFEGLAQDERGRIYVCEEADRWILRFDPATKTVERLAIDWTPVQQYFSGNPNASFEGIAIGGGKLWVANERERARIIEVDLETLKVVGDFAVMPSKWGLVLHYSDLAWHNNKLFVLLRHNRLVVQVDPQTRTVEAEFDFEAMEDAPEHEYLKQYPTGTMEGLVVDDQYFWLATDNNGMGRRKDPRDSRPTLFRCRRPDLK